MMIYEQLAQFWNGMELPTLVLTLLTAVSLLVIYLQQRRILPSPYFNLPKPPPDDNDQRPGPNKERSAKCRECSKLKPIAKLKICSNCKLATTASDAPDLNFYYCDAVCQKSNWKTHKLICGSFKNLQSTSTSPSTNSPDSFTLPPDNLINSHLDKRRTEIEALLKQWCEYHRNLLIFATIHGLDLLRNPNNSTQILLMISLNLNEDKARSIDETIIELTPKTEKGNRQEGQEKKKTENSKVHDLFSVAHIGSLDMNNFFTSNPGMLNASREMDKVRTRVHEKGGVGAGTLLIRFGSIVQVIPVGLPSQADLDSVPRQKNWREIFDNAIKTGLPWKPNDPNLMRQKAIGSSSH